MSFCRSLALLFPKSLPSCGVGLRLCVNQPFQIHHYFLRMPLRFLFGRAHTNRIQSTEQPRFF